MPWLPLFRSGLSWIRDITLYFVARSESLYANGIRGCAWHRHRPEPECWQVCPTWHRCAWLGCLEHLPRAHSACCLQGSGQCWSEGCSLHGDRERVTGALGTRCRPCALPVGKRPRPPGCWGEGGLVLSQKRCTQDPRLCRMFRDRPRPARQGQCCPAKGAVLRTCLLTRLAFPGLSRGTEVGGGPLPILCVSVGASTVLLTDTASLEVSGPSETGHRAFRWVPGPQNSKVAITHPDDCCVCSVEYIFLKN